jgi:dolichol-phosphate mannosyltransferase
MTHPAGATGPGHVKLSLVVPVFNEEEALPAFQQEVTAALHHLDLDLEILFIDDGSRDGTLAWLRAQAKVDKRVRYLSLSRNFGSHTAVAAGLAHVTGDAAAIVPADLQDPPSVVAQFVARWREGAEVVWGVRESREDPLARKLWSWLYYLLLRRLAFPEYPKGGTGSFCLIDRKVIDSINRFTEHNRLTFGIISLVGFRHASVLYRRRARTVGRSKWSLARRVQAALDSFVAYSFLPLRLISYVGLAMSAASFLAIIYVAVAWLVHGTRLTGWPSLIAVILFIGGAQTLMLGILGEYIWRIAEDVKARPLYIVKETDGSGA